MFDIESESVAVERETTVEHIKLFIQQKTSRPLENANEARSRNVSLFFGCDVCNIEQKTREIDTNCSRSFQQMYM